jgi:chorismate mutase
MIRLGKKKTKKNVVNTLCFVNAHTMSLYLYHVFLRNARCVRRRLQLFMF